MAGVPVIKDLVLVGGGHAHVEVLRQWAMRPLPAVRVTLVTRDVHTPYSGMLPGYLAGHYTYDDCHIDLARLARYAGARLVHCEARGIDTKAQRVLLPHRPPIPYDVLSLNTGIVPAPDAARGAAEHATPVKPINTFIARFDELLTRAKSDARALRLAVVGGGAGGVEIACALQWRLLREREQAGITAPLTTVLVSKGPMLRGVTPYARSAFLPLLQARGIQLIECEGGVVEVSATALLLADGQAVPYDECLWCTSASAVKWLRESGLPADADGFVLVNDFLQSAGGSPNVFAAGDIAANLAHPRPKAGVFAVRAGPPLAENLRRSLTGQPLRAWVPQSTFLTLISAGDKYAVAAKGWLGAQGAWVWQWKDHIDRTFMRKYGEELDFAGMARSGGGMQSQPQTASAGLDAEALALLTAAKMRCGGCGSKVGASILARVLGELQRRPGGGGDEAAAAAAVLVGLGAPDDAALLRPPPPGTLLVHSVDFFRAMWDDPFVFGMIAANHALGDCYAMGAQPGHALAIAAVPFAAPDKVEADLLQLMAGAVAVLDSAGCRLVGGHSTEGTELALGFSVVGCVQPDRVLTKGGLEPGHALILTKPVGTGVILAAWMRGLARGRWVTAAIDSMLCSNGPAVPILLGHGAMACTDVTGFGVLGHLAEMVAASPGVEVELNASAVPLLPGAMQCVELGALSSLHAENVLVAAVVNDDALEARGLWPLLVDPQTAGGLLAAVPSARADECAAALRGAGFLRATIVGHCTAVDKGCERRIRLTTHACV